ncbi:MAG: HEPN domain-containing protein [Chloroflexota bacterium]
MNIHRVEARRWLQQARADLEVVKTLRSAGHYAAACFHSQQAAEKALKAVLYSQGARVVLGHAAGEFVRQCQSLDVAFANLLGDAALLDQFYIPTRYPNGLPTPAVPSESYSESQAKDAQQAAERVLQIVEAYLRSHGCVSEDS